LPGTVTHGALYEDKYEPVVTLTEIKNSIYHGMDAKGSMGRSVLR